MVINDTSLWTALVTPMNEDRAVDTEDLTALIHRQEKAQNGVLLLGSTGEGLALGLDDKKKVIETAAALDLDVPLMAGVGGFNLNTQQQWIRYAQEYVDCLLLVTPLYAKPGLKGQVAWFKNLLDIADIPCILYNVPSRTGVKMNPNVLNELADHPTLFGLKEASGSVDEYQVFRKNAPNLSIYSGDDGIMPFFAAAGCQGLVSVMSNAWPKATHRYVEWCLEGRTAELLPLWQECSSLLFSAPNPIPVKTLLYEKDLIKHNAYRLPLTPDDLQDTKALIQADKRVQDWYNQTN